MNFTTETENGGIKPVLLNYGGAEKSLDEMSEEEIATAAKAILQRVKEKAFSKGLPIYYVKEDKIVAEYPDGTISTVTE